ncbi:Protein CBG13777 [Caenorhabditis briggsae]|uniref:Protein CBG13777 n=2 Tax=Caenorhabditis briggsae TaxID=6238 RepID=A8XIP1_CAEBR|nr:Protein CBG13777 [Caenorhabditis briggsae]ULT93313.1 hypothetical protein L3Y34_003059 [Caenorhabditis briggsae]CAP32516.2 Protein CBG13777 [Caenorhabditis briggsae]
MYAIKMVMKADKCDQDCEYSDDSCPNVCERKECPETCSSNKKYGCQNQKFRGYGIGKIKKSKDGKEAEPTKPIVEIRETGGKGKGLYATKCMEAGSFVIPFTGEYVSEAEKVKRFELYEAKMVDTYVLDSGCHFIDATVSGNQAQYINHSCDPNLIAEKWKLHAMPKNVNFIAFIAIKNINEGDELTFNYRFSRDDSCNIECKCGSWNCSGLVGKKENVRTDREVKKNGSKKRKIMEVDVEVDLKKTVKKRRC